MSPPHLQHNSNKSEAEAQVQNRHRLLLVSTQHIRCTPTHRRDKYQLVPVFRSRKQTLAAGGVRGVVELCHHRLPSTPTALGSIELTERRAHVTRSDELTSLTSSYSLFVTSTLFILLILT